MTPNITYMELRPSQVERIKRLGLSRHRKTVEPTPTQQLNTLIAWFGLGFGILIFCALLLVSFEVSPGNQAQIAREYRALRHDAIAMEEWK